MIGLDLSGSYMDLTWQDTESNSGGWNKAKAGQPRQGCWGCYK